MARTSSARHITPRDIEIFEALDRFPLTVEQLLKLSCTFSQPFRSLRRVQERLHALSSTGYLRQYRYATVTTGAAPAYYMLSLLGWRMLHGPKVARPRKRAFSPLSISLQEHERKLADFVVHTAVAAHRVGYPHRAYSNENDVTLRLEDERLVPDCAFQVIVPSGYHYNFLVELDNGTEPVCSKRERESWEKKIRFYDRYQNVCPQRFRVLAVTTRSKQRADHILETASQVVANRRRELLYAVTLDNYLNETDALESACFRNHRLQRVPLISSVSATRARETQATQFAPQAALC